MRLYLSDPVKRFWRYVDVKSPDKCWEWIGAKRQNGYGQLGVEKADCDGLTTIAAHRLSYIIANGSIPDNMQINHTCDNKSCVNPAHLYAGSQAQNMHDRAKRWKACGGPKKLKPGEEWLALKLLRGGVSQVTIGKIFKVSKGYAYKLLQRNAS